MKRKENNSFTLYLSASDSPIPFSDLNLNEPTSQRLKEALNLENNILEDFNEKTMLSIIKRRLVLNPFYQEEARNDLFSEYKRPDSMEDVKDLCRDSFMDNSIMNTIKNIKGCTGAFIDWENIQQNASNEIIFEFIQSHSTKPLPEKMNEIEKRLKE